VDGRKIGKYILAIILQSDLCEFFTKINPTTITVECQKFRILKIQDGGRICTETYGHRCYNVLLEAYRLDLSGRHTCFILHKATGIIF